VNMVDYLAFMHENRRMKPVEIVLRRRRRLRENDGGGESNKLYCKHIGKHRNAPLCNYYMLMETSGSAGARAQGHRVTPPAFFATRFCPGPALDCDHPT
jgi:hypothetical protein